MHCKLIHALTCAHMQGVLGMAWSPHDPSLLMSCAKDNRTICWDVHSTDMLCELPAHPGNWNFDVQVGHLCARCECFCLSSVDSTQKTCIVQEQTCCGWAGLSFGACHVSAC